MIIVSGTDEEELPFGNGPRQLNRTISINLKSLMSATDSPPPSPPTQTATSQTSTTSPGAKFPLVDYPDEDSDEDGEEAVSKRPRLDLNAS